VGLVNLWTPATGAAGWRTFWFYNWQDHWEIAEAIQSQLHMPQTLYLIQPWSDDGADGILERHQRFHNDMNAAIGFSGQDLSVIDFQNKAAVQMWIFSHYQEHLKARINLGLA
jgi:hypothetical protein